MVCELYFKLLKDRIISKKVQEGVTERVLCWNSIYSLSTTLRQSRGEVLLTKNILSIYIYTYQQGKSFFSEKKWFKIGQSAIIHFVTLHIKTSFDILWAFIKLPFTIPILLGTSIFPHPTFFYMWELYYIPTRARPEFIDTGQAPFC